MNKKKVEYYNKYINNLLSECYDDIVSGYQRIKERPACPSGVNGLDGMDYNSIFNNDQKRWFFKPKFYSVLHCELYYVYMFKLMYSKYVPKDLLKKMKAYLKKYKKIRHKQCSTKSLVKQMWKIEKKYNCSYTSHQTKTTAPAAKPAPKKTTPVVSAKPAQSSASSSQDDYYYKHQKEVERVEDKIRELKREARDDIFKIKDYVNKGYTLSSGYYVSGVHHMLVDYKDSIPDDVWNDLNYFARYDLNCLIDEYETIKRDYGNTL